MSEPDDDNDPSIEELERECTTQVQVRFQPLVVGRYRDASGRPWAIAVLALQARDGDTRCPLLATGHCGERTRAKLFEPTLLDDADDGAMSLPLQLDDAFAFICTDLLGFTITPKRGPLAILKDASLIVPSATSTTPQSARSKARPSSRRRRRRPGA